MKAALLAIAYNEPVFFPIWLGYYSRFFAPEDIHVIDNGSTDGSIDGEGFVRIVAETSHDDRIWRTRFVEEQQHRLLQRYDCVLCVDVDEIVAPDPRAGTLGDYLDSFDRELVNCLGYEVLHRRDSEPALDPGRPVLPQRSWWYPNPGYNKPNLASVPMRWVPGFHHSEDGRIALDPDLRLVHLHRVDFDIALERHRTRAARPSDPEDIAEGRGYHNRIADPERFEHWFYNDSCFEDLGVGIEPEPIPEHWKTLV
jgi:hypothetical protein